MKKSLVALTFALGLSANLTLAQTETTEATAGQSADQTFPVETSDEAVKVGQAYSKEKHGAWEIRCIKGEESDLCSLYQLAKDTEGNAVAEINLEVLKPGGQAAGGVTMVTPLGTLLTAKLRFKIDSGPLRSYDYSWCESAGCVSRFGLTSADIETMKKGNKIGLALVSIVQSDKPVNLELSLQGFTAAWNAASAQ